MLVTLVKLMNPPKLLSLLRFAKPLIVGNILNMLKLFTVISPILLLIQLRLLLLLKQLFHLLPLATLAFSFLGILE